MTDPSNAHAEKRGYKRMAVNTPAKITAKIDGEFCEGTCLNLSGGGMLLELPRSFDVGTVMGVSISSDHGHSPTLETECEVLRVEPADAPDMFHIGVKTTRIL